jgi:hypothetical protein
MGQRKTGWLQTHQQEWKGRYVFLDPSKPQVLWWDQLSVAEGLCRSQGRDCRTGRKWPA